MVTDEERREAIENLRCLSYMSRVRYKEEFYELLDETVMEPDTGYHEMNDVFERIADLIDRPTCRIILARELRTAFGKPITGINGYILSCGHQAVGFEKPRYCPECGMEVGE